MADFSVNFDTPKTSSLRTIQVTNFTVPNNNTQGYIRMKVTVTNATRNNIYYRTVSIPATSTTYSLHGTYNVAVSPKALATDTVTASYAISFTAQA